MVRVGAALLGAVETQLNPAAQSQTIVTAGTNGTKIEEIVVKATTTLSTATLVSTTAAGLVYLFLFDGTTYRLFDDIPITAVTSSATVAPFRASRTYVNLWIPSGWSLRASQTGNANILHVEAFGGDY